MEVIKKINNNSAVCIDSAGNEIVAIGTGIGFPAVPYTLEDLSKIQRTYYDVNSMYLGLLNQIPEEIFDISSKIVEWFRSSVNTTISSNLVFTLADHINFSIEREKKNILIENPLLYEIKHLYENEYNIGLKAIKLIYQELGVRLPKTEASNIALHLMNAKTTPGSENEAFHFEEILSDVVEIIGKHFRMYIDKDSVSYSRFVSHFQYLLKREQANKHISSENYKLFQSVTKEYPYTYKCVLKIQDYLNKELDFELTDKKSCT